MRHLPFPAARLATGIALILLAQGATAAPPTQPAGLRAAVYSPTAAELLWQRSSDDTGVLGYEIQVNGQVIGQFDALSYFSDELTPGVRYEVAVTAVDRDGERSPAATTAFTAGQSASATTVPSTPTAPTTPPTTTPVSAQGPASPVNLRGIAYSRTSFELFWDRQPARGLTYSVTLDGTLVRETNGVSAYFSGLERGRSYAVAVTTVDASGRRSTAATATLRAGNGSTPGAVSIGGAPVAPVTQPPTASAPASPRELRVSVYSDTAAELFWQRPAAGSGVVEHRILRDGTPVRETAGISFFDSGRTPGQRHRYEVIAVTAAGERSAPAVIVVDGGGVQPTTPVAPTTPPAVTPPPTTTPPVIAPPAGEVFASSATDLVLDRSLYTEDGYGTVDVVRVDLRTDTVAGSCTVEDDSGCTFDDVLGDTDKNDELKVDIAVHFSADDFADDGTPSNAELRQRGGGSRFAPQKSFRVKLDSKEVLWRNERFLQLNKHPFESSRFRNKAAFDLMQNVPHLPSFRTQFVNLWIDDGAGPQDQGLYTHVERYNDDWLKRRNLDGDGNLYKASTFRFDQNDLNNLAVDEDGKPLDKDRFESSLEIEEGKDHRAVAKMLAAVRNPDLDFDVVLDRHFNRNNVLAWMTVNLLMKQDDATRHNYMLYNPAGTERFYFVPWDYDAVFGEWDLPPTDFSPAALRERLDYGYALGHRNDFLQRYYRLPGIHERIKQAAAVLRNDALSDARIEEKSERFHDLVRPFQTRSPDASFNRPFNSASGKSFARAVGFNEQALSANFAIPMPPTLLPVTQDGNDVRIRWTPGYEVTGNTLSYDLEIATSADFGFGSIVLSFTGIADATGTVEQRIDGARLRTGQHFARLIARAASNPSRYWQVADNRLEDEDSTRYGVIAFDVR